MIRFASIVFVLLTACVLTLATCGTVRAQAPAVAVPAPQVVAVCQLIDTALSESGDLAAAWYTLAGEFAATTCGDKEGVRRGEIMACLAARRGGLMSATKPGAAVECEDDMRDFNAAVRREMDAAQDARDESTLRGYFQSARDALREQRRVERAARGGGE